MTSRGRHRHRLRICLALIVCLLFQQVALAAYACTLIPMPAEPVAIAETCAAMGMEQAKESPALCQKHCSPDLTIVTDHVAPSVPVLALPPMAFDPFFAESVSHVALAADVSINRSDPPPRLRYCSLLI